MIDIFLQDTIKAKLESIFKGFAVGRMGEHQLKVHKQDLPLSNDGEGDIDTDLFPYVIVRLLEGRKDDEASPHTVRVVLIVGVRDESSDRQGHYDLLNIMRKAEMELFRTRILEGKYEIVFPFKWMLQDEDLWPFYFGAIETNWNIAFIEREDDALWQEQA